MAVGGDFSWLLIGCWGVGWKPIAACFDGILSPFDLWGPLRQILMAFPPFSLMKPIVAYFAPLSLIGPIKADFDGISPLFTYEAHCGRF